MPQQHHTIAITARLLPEAKAFLECVAPGKSKGQYLTALLLQERVRREVRESRAGYLSDEEKVPQKAGR